VETVWEKVMSDIKLDLMAVRDITSLPKYVRDVATESIKCITELEAELTPEDIADIAGDPGYEPEGLYPVETTIKLAKKVIELKAAYRHTVEDNEDLVRQLEAVKNVRQRGDFMSTKDVFKAIGEADE
jgi:hypothetical protein